MKKFKTFLAEEKNSHMVHVENSVLYEGPKGVAGAIQALRDVLKMVGGDSDESKILTQKVDGAPAVFVGKAPDDGQFFVAKKGIFNKNPKVYKTIDDIKADTSGELQAKLIATFNAFKDFGIDTILQGDLMFTKSDVKTQTFDGVPHYTFQANTLVYAVPVDSDIGKQIGQADIGVVFHTEYKGKTYESLTANYNIDIEKYKNKNKKVFVQDAYIKDYSSAINLDQADQNRVEAALTSASAILSSIDRTVLTELEKNKTLAQNIETFQNSFIRSAIDFSRSKNLVEQLIQWFKERFAKEYESRKSDVGKTRISAKEAELMKFFSNENKVELKALFDLQRHLIDAKTILVNHLDKINSLKTFVRTKDGFKVTGSEGFVIADKIDGKSYKLVDRLVFSHNNFSKNILRAWDI